MDKKISPNRAKKEKIVAELSEKAARSKGMVFTNYQGLTHKQLENLKKKIKAMDADFVATKNTLILKSIENLKNKLLSPLKGATATLFLYGDPVGPLKEIAKAIKEFNLPASPAGGQGGPTIKFGILDGVALTSEQILKLSTLASRETLLTQFVFALKYPISGLHRALNWNIQKFVMTLKAIEENKR